MTMVDELGQLENTQSFYQDLSKLKGLLPDKEDRPLYRHWTKRLMAVNETFTVTTDSGYPDYWIVYCLPSWSATPGQLSPSAILIYQDATAMGGDPEVAITGGGSVRIPGVSEYLSLVTQLVGTPNGTMVGIIAARKSPIDIQVQPGGG